MKKIILTMVAMMAFTFASAETKKVNNVMNNVERYDMTVDMRRLAAKLDLTSDQMDAVQVVHENFSDEIQSAATAEWYNRRHLVHEAVKKNAHYMQNVLNDKQFRTYMTLLTTTLRNRGL